MFAVWAVRREAADADPETISRVWQAMQESRAWGAGHTDEILHEAELRTALSPERLRSYFSGLLYHFDGSLQEAYRRYRAYANECGLLNGVSEPVFFNPAVTV